MEWYCMIGIKLNRFEYNVLGRDVVIWQFFLNLSDGGGRFGA